MIKEWFMTNTGGSTPLTGSDAKYVSSNQVGRSDPMLALQWREAKATWGDKVIDFDIHVYTRGTAA